METNQLLTLAVSGLSVAVLISIFLLWKATVNDIPAIKRQLNFLEKLGAAQHEFNQVAARAILSIREDLKKEEHEETK
jgi:hypothetical protein